MEKKLQIQRYDDLTVRDCLATTDHPASSYNLPVIVFERGGSARGSADLTWGKLITADAELAKRLADAGYKVATNYIGEPVDPRTVFVDEGDI